MPNNYGDKPNTFRDKNGANMAGHSEKWSNSKRRANSHDAGQGSRGSRNMGTGIQGKLNTMPDAGMDTSKMSQEDKLKYFNSLGLLNPKEIKPAKPVEPKPAKTKIENPIKSLSQRLTKIFSTEPNLLEEIIGKLQFIPDDDLWKKSIEILNSINDITDPVDAFEIIMTVI